MKKGQKRVKEKKIPGNAIVDLIKRRPRDKSTKSDLPGFLVRPILRVVFSLAFLYIFKNFAIEEAPMIPGWKPSKYIPILLALILITSSGLSQTPPNNAAANHGTQKEADPTAAYKTACGQCHMAYPPHFLPSASWMKVLETDKNHFGTPLDLAPQTKEILVQFLGEQGADKSDTRIADKIMASLDEDAIPLRLTEVPYITNKHRKISSEVLQRKSIGSLANCNACHRKATEWSFSKWVTIPD
jgi:hypothetical protein